DHVVPLRRETDPLAEVAGQIRFETAVGVSAEQVEAGLVALAADVDVTGGGGLLVRSVPRPAAAREGDQRGGGGDPRAPVPEGAQGAQGARGTRGALGARVAWFVRHRAFFLVVQIRRGDGEIHFAAGLRLEQDGQLDLARAPAQGEGELVAGYALAHLVP